jgi:hypothetical protein
VKNIQRLASAQIVGPSIRLTYRCNREHVQLLLLLFVLLLLFLFLLLILLPLLLLLPRSQKRLLLHLPCQNDGHRCCDDDDYDYDHGGDGCP